MPPLIQPALTQPKPDTGAGAQAGSTTPAAPPAVTPYSSLWDLFQSSQSGTNAAAQSQQDLLSQQLGLVGANYTTQSGYINQDLQNQLAQLGIQGGQQGIQQGALNRQQALLPQQNALQQQQFGIQQGALDRLQQLYPQLYGIQQQQFGIQGAGLDAQQQQAQQQADISRRGAQSSATSRGAINTQGYGQQLGDISNQLQQSLGGIDRSRQSLGLQQQQAGLENTQQMAGLSDQQKNLGISEKQSALGYGESQAQLADQQKNLDLMAQQQGLSTTEVKQRAQQALDQLGLSSALNVNDITQAMVDSVSGQFNPLSNFLGLIYQLSGLRPPTDSFTGGGGGGFSGQGASGSYGG